MDAQTAYDFIERTAYLVAIRGQKFTPDVTLRVAEVLMQEGINIFELTMNSVTPIETMQAVKREYGAEACVGMGTVLDVESAKRVLDAGADFVVSPAFQPEVVREVQAAGVFVAPGIVTPSEAVAAWSMGVKMLKIFPIGPLGVDYFKAFLGPLDHMKFMCNGGMNGDNAREFLKAGAVACGMSGWLSGDGTTSLDTIRGRARLLRNVVEEVRTGKKVYAV
jgi:2-dehydro-3-deoxyphosphogluconate aldolase/(4S)-4-hydroxy-2-oxoglutarate aldolase